MFPFLHLTKRGDPARQRRTWHPKAGRRKVKRFFKSRRKLAGSRDKTIDATAEYGRGRKRTRSSVSSWNSRRSISSGSLSSVSSVTTYTSESSVSYEPTCPQCQPLAVLVPPGQSCIVRTRDGDVHVHAPAPVAWYDTTSSASITTMDTDSSLSTISTMSSRQPPAPPNHRWPILRSRPLRGFWGHPEGVHPRTDQSVPPLIARPGETQWRSSETASGTRVGGGSPKVGEYESRDAASPDSGDTISPVSVGIEHNWDR
ncbi:uncharacterized protein SCHCODRAFT_02258609 [Schizophyllum commune H4-8]|uniref:uncharacterized protein n=1 Tax=Schizophyllum commune (strain H4-8 / FGSC 9210) TaxID=578458 RepID=UPI00215EF949|nr:uncharacterized protein SCHCODRAFT_02258609 [Schizophyllum commune H4-8]KAI5893676.1 hypothetical protein SCHCODRAFT_02258609 [Schizophyllum commune H4-8]